MDAYIEELKQKVQHVFNENWLESFHFDEDSYVDDWKKEKESFANLLNVTKEEIFQCLNASVLVGEYVSHENLDFKIREILGIVNAIPQPVPPNLDIQKFVIYELKSNFIEVLLFCLNAYLYLCVKIKNIFEINNKEFILTFTPAIDQLVENHDFNPSSLQNINFFSANIDLSLIDQKLTPDVSDFNTLIQLSESLLKEKRFGVNKLAVLLREKCNYLLCKWLLRKQHLTTKEVYYLRDNEEVKADINSFKNTFINNWKTYIESHYEISTNWKSEVQSDFDKIKRKNLEMLDLLDLHRLIKYYKDVNRDLNNLSKVVKEIEQRFSKAKSDNNRDLFYSYSIAFVYALNNEFSLLLETKKEDETIILEKYQHIQSVQSTTGIKNFFAQYKYLEFLVRNLEVLYSQRKAMGYLSSSRKLITQCEDVIKSYTENVNWSEEHYNYTFQLPYNECLISVSDTIITNCYISSSFLLPLSKEKYKKEFSDNINKVNKFNSSIEVFENLENEISEFKDTSSKLKELSGDIQQREVKTMEILGIFTAVVTFVLGSLPTFKYVHTPYQAALFMFALSTSLGVFVLLILTINRGIDKLIERKKTIGWLVSFAVISWSTLILFTHDPNIIILNEDQLNNEKLAVEKLDSTKIKRQIFLIDSINASTVSKNKVKGKDTKK